MPVFMAGKRTTRVKKDDIDNVGRAMLEGKQYAHYDGTNKSHNSPTQCRGQVVGVKTLYVCTNITEVHYNSAAFPPLPTKKIQQTHLSTGGENTWSSSKYSSHVSLLPKNRCSRHNPVVHNTYCLNQPNNSSSQSHHHYLHYRYSEQTSAKA